MQKYPLAPMSPVIFWMTFALLFLPPVLLYAGSSAPGPLGTAPAVFVLGIYLLIWLYPEDPF